MHDYFGIIGSFLQTYDLCSWIIAYPNKHYLRQYEYSGHFIGHLANYGKIGDELFENVCEIAFKRKECTIYDIITAAAKGNYQKIMEGIMRARRHNIDQSMLKDALCGAARNGHLRIIEIINLSEWSHRDIIENAFAAALVNKHLEVVRYLFDNSSFWLSRYIINDDIEHMIKLSENNMLLQHIANATKDVNYFPNLFGYNAFVTAIKSNRVDLLRIMEPLWNIYKVDPTKILVTKSFILNSGYYVSSISYATSCCALDALKYLISLRNKYKIVTSSGVDEAFSVAIDKDRPDFMMYFVALPRNFAITVPKYEGKNKEIIAVINRLREKL